MKKVLVIDDDSMLLQCMKLVLESEHYEVVTASNGLEGLEALSDDIDLIVLDLSMPVMSGSEFHDKLREQADLDHIPVVILSGLERPDPIECVEIVKKPINVMDLLGIIGIYTSDEKGAAA
jgi:CheY-like chemotaxis protein